VENHSRAELLDQVLDEVLPRYVEALGSFPSHARRREYARHAYNPTL
jgi:hypothetical protein